MKFRIALVLVAVSLTGCLSMNDALRTALAGSRSGLEPSLEGTARSTSNASDRELAAGVDWLWAAFTRLKKTVADLRLSAPVEAAILEDALESARIDIADAEAAARDDDPLTARSRWRACRKALGDVASACLGLAVRYGAPKIADAIRAGG